MPAAKYRVRLKAEERELLGRLTQGGECRARKLKRAQILLAADAGRRQEDTAVALGSSRGTFQRICRRYCEEGLSAALEERPRAGGRPKLDAKARAHLLAIACSEAPEGRARWTLQLLADRLVALGVVDSIADETVRRALEKGGSSRGRRSSGASRA